MFAMSIIIVIANLTISDTVDRANDVEMALFNDQMWATPAQPINETIDMRMKDCHWARRTSIS